MKKIRKMSISVSLPIDLITYLDTYTDMHNISVSDYMAGLITDDKFLEENSTPYTGEVYTSEVEND